MRGRSVGCPFRKQCAVGETGTAVTPTLVPDIAGTYVVQLVVSDGQVSSSPDTVTISTSNSAPVASAGPDQSFVSGQIVALDRLGIIRPGWRRPGLSVEPHSASHR